MFQFQIPAICTSYAWQHGSYLVDGVLPDCFLLQPLVLSLNINFRTIFLARWIQLSHVRIRRQLLQLPKKKMFPFSTIANPLLWFEVTVTVWWFTQSAPNPLCCSKDLWWSVRGGVQWSPKGQARDPVREHWHLATWREQLFVCQHQSVASTRERKGSRSEWQGVLPSPCEQSACNEKNYYGALSNQHL